MSATPIPLSAAEVLDREFLLIRAKLLEIAASLDRIDRAGGSVADDARMERIREAIAAIQSDEPGRAEVIQKIFSIDYDADWREKYFPQNKN